jgi:hypothetical protein
MLAATGGTTPYTWTEKSGGNLPGGLSLTASSGAIAGTPTASGTFGPYVFTVTDANNKTADSPSLMITIMSSTTEAACAATPKSRGNEAALTTPFAFEANGAINGAGEPDSAAAWAGSFTPDGKGGISAADIDFVGTKDGHSSFQVQTIGSAYSYGSDGRGCLYLAFNGVNVDKADKLPIDGNASLLRGTGGLRRESVHAEGALANVGTVTFSFALGENGVVGRIEQFDYINSAMVTAGLIMQQTPSDFAVSKLASHFAFGADGWASMDAQGDVVRVAIAGAVANSNGALSNSEADDNIGGVPSGKLSGSGSSGSLGTTISSTTGKGTGSYMIPDGGSTLTFNFTYYVINQSDFLFITTDSPSTVGALQLTGRALASTFGAVSLNGSYIPALQGIESGNNTLTIGTLAATSEGVISSATFYTNNGGSSQTQPFSNGGYAADGLGRVTFSKLQSNPPIAYLTNTASLDAIAAFMVGTDVDTASGFLALQTTNTPNFGQSSLMGSYAVGSFEDPSGMNGSNTGTATFDGKGGYTDLLDIVMFFEDASQPNVQGSGTVMSINADGSGTLGNGAQFVTNGTITLAIDGASLNKHPLGYIFIKQ